MKSVDPGEQPLEESLPKYGDGKKESRVYNPTTRSESQFPGGRAL